MNFDDNSKKLGTKGIPTRENIKLQTFKEVLFTNNSHYVNIKSLQLKNGEMARVSTTKKGLSDIFVKYHVENDGITCTPLKINGKYV